MMKFPEVYRWNPPSIPQYHSSAGATYGLFLIPGREAKGRVLRIMAVDGENTGWEHVSVSIEGSSKCPSWEEMCAVKNLFWEEEDCVVQFHPAKSEYVNFHPGVLHLWRNPANPPVTPPAILVGPK